MKYFINNKYIAHKEIIHNFFWRSFHVFGKQGINFLIFIISAKLLSPYEFGVYNYSLAIIFFLVIFGDFGISTATSKYVAEYNITDKEKFKSILFNSGIIIASLSLIVFLLVLIFGKYYLGDKFQYFIYLSPILFLAPMTSLYDGIFRGLKKIKFSALISVSVGTLSTFFVYFFIKKYGLVGALLAQNLFYFLLFFAYFFSYKELHFKINKTVIKDISKYSIIIGLIWVSYFLYTRVDIIILGHFGYFLEVGYYEIVNKVIMLLLIPVAIFSQIEAPNIVTAYYQNKKEKVLNKFKKSIKYSFLFSISLSIVAGIVAPLILKVFFIEYYNPVILNILFILLISFSFQNVANLAGNTFIISTGHAKINMINIIIFGFLNLIFGIIFIKIFGFMGVAYAKLIVLIPGSISLVVFYFLTLKKELIPFK